MFVDENTKKIADEVIGLTKAGITEVWQKIQQAAPELWKMAVRQKMLDGAELAGVAVLCLIGGFICWWGAKKLWEPNGVDNFESYMVGILGGIASVLGFVISAINAVDFLGNPAYWALKDILEMVRH